MTEGCSLDLLISLIEQEEATAPAPVLKKERSEIHQGDTDSSDDEDNRYFENRKYNNFGADIKRKLREGELEKKETELQGPLASKEAANYRQTTLVEPLFCMRVCDPVVSVEMIKALSTGRKIINLFKLNPHVSHGNLKDDWITGGVIVSKSAPKTSAKSNQYIIWKFSDLKGNLLTASLFLFGNSYKDLWKTSVGTVFGVLNPRVMDSNSKAKDVATLSVFNPDQIMIWGKSPELGSCKAKKRDGDPCGALVNKYACEYCIHHVKSEYRKFTGRSELQATTCGKLPSNHLRNKILGKSEVFYGGQSFTAIKHVPGVSKKNPKEVNQLKSLGVELKGPPPKVCKTETPIAPRTAALLRKLSEPTSKTPPPISKSEAPRLSDPSSDIFKKSPTLSQPKSRTALQSKFNSLLQSSKVEKSIPKKMNSQVLRQTLEPNSSQPQPAPIKPVIKELVGGSEPKQSGGTPRPIFPSSVPLNSSKRPTSAKLRALSYVKNHGPIAKESTPRPDKVANLERALKRRRSDSDDDESAKDKVVFSERFLKMLKENPFDMHLMQVTEYEKMTEYFGKLEKREEMEEKMLSTFKVECKAVKCLNCKYTWFKASDDCKKDGHQLRVIDAVKRFFKCSKCSNRTVSLHIIPLINCLNCGNGNWVRAPMMREKLCLPSHSLSIRGGEQKYFNSQAENANLDLNIPDEGTQHGASK